MESEIGIIYCDHCNSPALTYDLDFMKNAPAQQLIEAKHFQYIGMDGPFPYEEARCPRCEENIIVCIMKEWEKLKETREWDLSYNE